MVRQLVVRTAVAQAGESGNAEGLAAQQQSRIGKGLRQQEVQEGIDSNHSYRILQTCSFPSPSSPSRCEVVPKASCRGWWGGHANACFCRVRPRAGSTLRRFSVFWVYVAVRRRDLFGQIKLEYCALSKHHLSHSSVTRGISYSHRAVTICCQRGWRRRTADVLPERFFLPAAS